VTGKFKSNGRVRKLVIATIALLVATLLAVFSLKPGQASRSGERVSEQATPATQVAGAVNAEER
jgi:hypothetical protein